MAKRRRKKKPLTIAELEATLMPGRKPSRKEREHRKAQEIAFARLKGLSSPFQVQLGRRRQIKTAGEFIARKLRNP